MKIEPFTAYNSGRIRVFKLPFNVLKGVDVARKIFSVEKRIAGDLEANNSWSEKAKSYQYDVVCISDAFTHVERLVFGSYLKNGEYLPYLGHALAGRYTMMIYGGDDYLVWPDKVYLRYLRILNEGEKRK